MIDLKAIEARERAASEGSHIGDLLKQLEYARKEGIVDASRRLNEFALRSITESLQDIPDLIAEVKRLREENRWLTKAAKIDLAYLEEDPEKAALLTKLAACHGMRDDHKEEILKLREELNKRHDAQLVIDRLRLELGAARQPCVPVRMDGEPGYTQGEAQFWHRRTDELLTERDRYRGALEELRGFAEECLKNDPTEDVQFIRSGWVKEVVDKALPPAELTDIDKLLGTTARRTPVDTMYTEVYDNQPLDQHDIETMPLPAQEVCPECQGIGRVVITGGQSADDTCPACRGSGEIQTGECNCGAPDIGMGIMHEPGCGIERCPTCQGTGKKGGE